jgi:endothelin-converting enzyme/putative endopeptidase
LDDARAGMNLDIRPQDDLFGHVNGRWLDEVEIPGDRSSWGPFVQLADDAEAHVREIIESLAAGDTGGNGGGDDARKIATLYASFMDEATIESLGLRPLRPVLEAAASLRDVRDMAGFLGEFEGNGGSGLFLSYVDNDDRDAERNIVYFRQGGLGLPDETYYRDDKFAEIRDKYVAHLATMFGLAGVDDADERAAAVLRLETRLAEGHWERAETRDVIKTYNLKTFAELGELCPAFDWESWVRNLGGGRDTLFEVCVRQPSYLEHLSAVLEETPVEDWRSYVLAKVIRSAAPYLPDAFVQANFDFFGRTLAGTPELRARWKRGVTFVEGAMGEAVGREYVARHFPPHSKAMMDELVANLVEAYRRSITGLDWMSEETKQRAFDKLATFHPKIGYPVKWRDYSNLKFYPGELLRNATAAASFETARQLAKIGAPVDKDEWLMLPQQVNAYYNPGTNEICFPAGILQRPFFSPDADAAENYGGIGAVIGHEIGHGFDDQGAQYDGTGNLNDWWTAEDKSAFEVKSKALVEQYNGFEPRELAGEHVNGALTVGENIGDLGGLAIAYQAYLISREGDASSEEAVSIEDRQRVFLNWAYCWRTKRRKETALQYLTIDPHSPPEFRANIVRNLDEFHAAFATTASDALWLDPEDRVRIW